MHLKFKFEVQALSSVRFECNNLLLISMKQCSPPHYVRAPSFYDAAVNKALVSGWAGFMALYELAVFDPSDPSVYDTAVNNLVPSEGTSHHIDHNLLKVERC
ncbi:hypothetical protein Mapa_006055 [Marchantia paleacea]|nr:hypothetical protein Mapa_006055 [Marchantia paleacea]